MKFLKQWLYLLIIFLCFCTVYIIAKIWANNYDIFSEQLLLRFNRIDRLTVFKEKIFTIPVFWFLRFFTIFIFIILSLIIIFYRGKTLWVQMRLVQLFRPIKKYILHIQILFSQLKKKEKLIFWIFFFCFSLFKVYLIFRFPLLYDEAFNYTFIASKGFFTSIGFYPAPNNHVFHTALVSILNTLYLPPLLCIRIPDFIFSIFSFFLVFALFYKRQQVFWTSFLFASLFWHFAPIVFYTIAGRGYVIYCFFTIVLAILTLKKAKNPNNPNFPLVFTTVLGLYTLPTFLYAWVCTCVFLLRKIKLKILVRYVFWTIIGTLIYYTPILIFNNIELLINNRWVKRLALDIWLYNFPSFYKKIGNYIFGFEYGYILLTILYIASLIVYFKTKKSIYLYLIILLYLPWLIIFIQGVLPFERIFIYLIFIVLWFIYIIIDEFGKNLVYIILSLFFGYFIINNHQAIIEVCDKKPSVHQKSNDIVKRKPKLIFTNDYNYYAFLSYYTVIRKNHTYIHTSFDQNTDYNYLVIAKRLNFDKRIDQYKLIDQDKEVYIYKNINF